MRPRMRFAGPRFWLVVALLAICTSGCNRRTDGNAARDTKVEKAAVASQRVARKIYPYSLIPGGIASAAELQEHSNADPVLLRHYEGLGRSLNLEQLGQDRFLYASYRVGDEIYWTKKPLLVHAGEGVLNDGTSLVRARCGNRLSSIPRQPVRKFEPPVLTTDKHEVVITEVPTPEIPLVVPPLPMLPALPTVTPPVVPPERVAVVPPEIPPSPGTSIVPVPAPTPPLIIPPGKTPGTVYTPETGSWVLMAIGLALVIGVALFRRKSQIARN